MDDTAVWKVRGHDLSLRDPMIMGIVNVTPDSFSDGGEVVGAAAVSRGLAMAAAGAAIIDVGGESTRPNAEPVDSATEMSRILPVVAGLADRGVVVSIDTSKPDVAAQAIEAGASIVNDITGLRSADMRDVCASTGAGVVIMHMAGDPTTMQEDPRYDDVVSEVGKFLANQCLEAIESGIHMESIAIDPGFGFGKSFEHNVTLLQRLNAFVHLGYPVVVGTSRKGFLGAILERERGATEPAERDGATAATLAMAVAAGAHVLRVHNVALGLDVATTAKAMVPEEHDGEEINRT